MAVYMFWNGYIYAHTEIGFLYCSVSTSVVLRVICKYEWIISLCTFSFLESTLCRYETGVANELKNCLIIYRGIEDYFLKIIQLEECAFWKSDITYLYYFDTNVQCRKRK